MKFQPYFVAYAKAHGRSPEAQLESDRAAWPGGLMCRFILWINERKKAFRELHPEALTHDGNILDYAKWGSFLEGSL